jgi:hypothetical protein
MVEQLITLAKQGQLGGNYGILDLSMKAFLKSAGQFTSAVT